jgi:ribose 5-phosphate isomerase B
MLSLGQRTMDLALALRLVQIFLESQFEGGRHLARVGEIENRK